MNVSSSGFEGRSQHSGTAIRVTRKRRVHAHVKPADWPQVLCVTYISIWVISPPMMIGQSFRAVALFAAILWIVIEFARRAQTFLSPSPLVLAASLFVVYSVIVAYSTQGPLGLIENIQLYIFLFFLVLFESYRKRDFRQLRIVFWMALLVNPIWLVTTLVTYRDLAGASRLLSHSGDIQSELVRQGVGGYGMVYSAVVALPVMLYLLKSRIVVKPSLRLLLVLNLILSYAVIFRAGYALGLVLMVVGTVITLVVGRLDRSTLIKATLIIVLVLSVSPFLASAVPDWAEQFFQGTLYERKIRDARRSMAADRPVGTIQDRTELYARSVLTFMGNPIFGSLGASGAGGHSSVLDSLARYGGLFGIMLAYAIWRVPLGISRGAMHTSAFGMTLAISCVVILVSVLNKIVANLGFVLFVFYPVAMTYINETRWPGWLRQAETHRAIRTN